MGVIEEIVEFYSRYDLKDALDADENVADENRLLPAMNKIWPFLVSCFKSGNQLVSIASTLLGYIFCESMHHNICYTVNFIYFP